MTDERQRPPQATPAEILGMLAVVGLLLLGGLQ